jgi:DNA-binding MarR family transcriptional regulator
MHQRYDDRYGRVRSPDDGIGRGLWDNAAVSAPLFMGTLLLAFAWIAVCFIYIPEHTPVADNHALPLFAGYALVLQSLQAPDRTTRAVYTVGALSLVAATLLPLVHPAPQTVAVVNYGMLGAVVASVGLYNHRLLTQTFGASERLAPGKSVPESARLALLTALSSCGKATPTFLQNATGLSKGSLSTSLSALKDQGIVDIETTFDGTTRVAYAFITEPGRRTLARCADEHPSLREAVMDLEKAT